MPRKLSRRTLRRREELAIGGEFVLNQVDAKAVVARYIAGEKIKDMAAQYGSSATALYAHIIKFAPDEWIAAQKAKAFDRKERGEEMIENADNPLDLAIGRESTRAGQWDLERVWRKEYGREEQTLNINISDLGDRLRRARERVLEGQHTIVSNEQQSIEHKEGSGSRITVARAQDVA